MTLPESLITDLSVSDIFSQFHFIRPYWLLLIFPALLMAFLLLRREKNNNTWQQHIDAELLQPLLQGKINAPGKKLPVLITLFLILATLALAGPTWQKLPQPVEKRDNALVILMDLSPSMLAGDVKPSRLIAARHKILDLLQLRKEGYTALIGYSGDAHVVAPLTDDTKTIANLLNVLEPGIMPTYGSNVEHALTLALELLQRGGYAQGDILLVTDGITAQALEQSTNLLKGKPFTLSIIGVGTEEGGPIPTNNGAQGGGFVKNQQGTIILPQLHAEQLMALAKNVNGYYSPLQLNDNDIQPLITGTQLFNKQNTKKTDREFDQWRDTGALLCLLLLPFVLAAFRRGLLISLVLVIPLIHAPTAQAADTDSSAWHLPSWDSLWLNDNQRAMKAMEKKDYESAAKQFKDSDWKASAQYNQGDYDSALKQFQKDASTKGFYNQGNALAKSGKLPEAISAYNEALKKNPQFDNAAFNKKIVEELLKQQKKQDPKNNQSDKQDDKSQDQQQQDKKQQGNDDKNNDQKDKQSGNQQKDQNSDQNKNDQQKDAKSDPKNKDEQNPDQKDKAHQENDKSKSDQDAQADKKEAEQKQLDKQAKKQAAANSEDKLSPEQKQALEQWLRQVPDDPSGLLRNKFEYYYQQHMQEQQSGKTAKQMNNEERW